MTAPIQRVVLKLRALQYIGTNGVQIRNALNNIYPVATWSILSDTGTVLVLRKSEADNNNTTIHDFTVNLNDVLVAGEDGTSLGEILSPSAFAAKYLIV